MNVGYLQSESQNDLAYSYFEGGNRDLPTVIFLGGYRSDMNGTKALFLDATCRARGQSFLRFDYSGHGESEGYFEDCTISLWKNDALRIIEALIPKDAPLLIVGSSMGGWIGFLVMAHYQKTKERSLVGMIGIAAAPDFTKMMYDYEFNDVQRAILDANEILYVENDYSDEPYSFKKAFFVDGEQQMVLDKHLKFDVPVILLQGLQDKDVPYEVALAIQENIGAKSGVEIITIDDGDHRLSRGGDLELLDKTVRRFK
jgi:pimeloyl-ACP methyl ester carboxylesterase